MMLMMCVVLESKREGRRGREGTRWQIGANDAMTSSDASSYMDAAGGFLCVSYPENRRA